MKLNISFPANGSQKLIEIEDERKLRVFMDKRYDFAHTFGDGDDEGWGLELYNVLGLQTFAYRYIALSPISHRTSYLKYTQDRTEILTCA